MSKVVGIFDDAEQALEARCLLTDKGCEDSRLILIGPAAGDLVPHATLKHRGETMLRSAVRWAVLGALIVEIPSVVLVLLLPVDVNVKVFMGATMWKFGAAFGAWFGAMAVQERGLEDGTAQVYEEHLQAGRWILSADVPRRQRPAARGAMIESDALEVRDVVGTFEAKPTQPAKHVWARW